MRGLKILKYLMDKKIVKKDNGLSGDVMIMRDPALLTEFMQQPTLKIAEAITGAMAQGWSGLAVSGGRIIQGAIKGKMMEQLGKELLRLVEDGKIKEDYAGSKYGFKTLAELLDFIDSEAPDEDRFIAVKSVFYAINSINAIDSEEILNYQIFQIIKKLTSSQIILLKLCHDSYIDYGGDGPYQFDNNATSWENKMVELLGHNIIEIVRRDETALIENLLLTKRMFPDGSGIYYKNARLTSLGIKICEYINSGL